MFNGIVKNTGLIQRIKKNKKSMSITVQSNIKIEKNMLGSSISCDGVCLTLTKKKNNFLTFYLSQETIKRSKFSKARRKKNKYRKSLKVGDEISGVILKDT